MLLTHPHKTHATTAARGAIVIACLAALAIPAGATAQGKKPPPQQPIRHLTLCVDMSNTDIGTVTVERGPCELGKGELGGGGGDGGGPTNGGVVTGPKGPPDLNRCESQLRFAQNRCKTMRTTQARSTCESEAIAQFMRCEAGIVIH
jgi:hypothetical protein